MYSPFKNLVFSGGGILGIAYLGMLDYLSAHHLLEPVQKLAGTSAGAITACLTSFNLPFTKLKAMADSLDYTKVPGKEQMPNSRYLSSFSKTQLNRLFGNIDCVYRLVKQYGWYSSSYFYEWMKAQIASQFDQTKKSPPYTFADFKNTSIHINERPFKDIYLIGTNITTHTSVVFSEEYTPDMEVAQAIRISMSVPLFFEAVKSPEITSSPKIYTDGGLIYNYPINLFDETDALSDTLGVLFKSIQKPASIHNIVDFITNVLSCSSGIQTALYENNPAHMKRTILIHTSDISSMDFNVTTGDETYNFLYEQGYRATELYFSLNQ